MNIRIKECVNLLAINSGILLTYCCLHSINHKKIAIRKNENTGIVRIAEVKSLYYRVSHGSKAPFNEFQQNFASVQALNITCPPSFFLLFRQKENHQHKKIKLVDLRISQIPKWHK